MDDNYLIIKNQEIEVGEKSGVLIVDFSKNTDDLISNFKIEQKEVSKRKNETNSKCLDKLDSLNASHKDHLESLHKLKVEIEDNYNEELEDLESLKTNESNSLNKSLEDIEKDYVTQTKSLLEEYEANIAESNKEIERINLSFETEKVVLSDQLKEEKNTHEDKMNVLNSDINAKIDKLKAESNKSTNKLVENMGKTEEEYIKEFEDYKFEYDYSMENADKKHTKEQENYDNLTSEIKSTLEAKVTRHEKFMNKSIQNNDTRAVKQHKKEILMLQKNAEKRLIDLSLEHKNEIKEYDLTKKKALKEHLEKSAEFDIKFVQFKEIEEFKIKSNKVKVDNDLECIEFRIKSRIHDEMLKFTEQEKDNVVKVAECVLKHENDIEKELENKSKLKITYEKVSGVNKIKKDEAFETIQKDLKVLEVNINSKLKSAELQKSINLANIDHEIEIVEKEKEFDIKVSLENKNIELLDLDSIVQGEVHDKKSLLKDEINTLIDTKEDFILTFEEEVLNKSIVTVKLLEKQKSKILDIKIALISKISEVFEPKTMQKESSEDTTIEVAEEGLPEEQKNEEVEIDLEEIEERKQASLIEIEEFFTKELSKIDNMINLLNEGKSEELKDVKGRNLKMFESSSLLLLNAQLRNSKLTEDSNVFDESKVKTENVKIKDIKRVFNVEKEKLKVSNDKVILEFDKELKTEELSNQKLIGKEDLDLSNKINSFNKQVKEIENTEIKSLKNQELIHNANCSKAESIEKLEVKKANSEFALKESVHNKNASKIDKEVSVFTKQLDLKNKVIKKEHDVSLSNKLREIKTKLQKDLKALQTK